MYNSSASAAQGQRDIIINKHHGVHHPGRHAGGQLHGVRRHAHPRAAHGHHHRPHDHPRRRLGVSGRFTGRHRGHSTATRIFFRASFSLFLPFMSYAFSQAKSKGNQPRAQLILLWMILVEILRKKVYALVAPAGDAFARGVGRYSFFDAVEEAARMVWIGYLIYTYVHGFGVKSFFIILWIFSVVKMCKRAICIQLAKSSFDLAKNASLREVTPYGLEICDQEVKNIGLEIHDHKMKNIKGDPTDDQVTKKSELVRVCNIFDLAETDTIFKYNDSRRHKMEDICLALALFKLLRRKMEHFHMAETKTTQACDLVLQGLLKLTGDETVDAKRAFEVVELELRFLDEYYQAIIPLALPKPKLFMANFAFSIVFILLYCITVLLITGNGNIFGVLGSLFRGLVGLSIDMVVQYQCFLHQVDFLVDMVCSSSDLIISFLLTLTLLAVETYEFVQYLLSDWFVASLLCNYARTPAPQRPWRVQLVIKGTLWVKHRSRPVIKVHQVTMLKLHQLTPRRVWMLVSHLLKRRLVGLPDAIVTTNIKLAIVRVLKDIPDPSSDKDFSNGICALRKHEFPHLEWACSDKMDAATVIVVWHIATALFETRDRHKHPLPPDGKAALML
ncbi:hypothetical protein VPH35_114290 [Triticum aestivum]